MPTFISKLGLLLSNLFIELSPCTCMIKYFSVQRSLQKSEQASPFFFLNNTSNYSGFFSFSNSQTYFDGSMAFLDLLCLNEPF